MEENITLAWVSGDCCGHFLVIQTSSSLPPNFPSTCPSLLTQLQQLHCDSFTSSYPALFQSNLSFLSNKYTVYKITFLCKAVPTNSKLYDFLLIIPLWEYTISCSTVARVEKSDERITCPWCVMKHVLQSY